MIALAGLALILFVLPWLGKRGDLNRYIEGAIATVIDVPVTIESIDTAPLSHLTISRLRSVEAKRAGTVDFRANEITLEYDPVDLFAGHIERAVFKGPHLYLNLGADLKTLIDTQPSATDSADDLPPTPTTGSDAFLPFRIGELLVAAGDVRLQIGTNVLPLSNLRVKLFELGSNVGQSFELDADVLGARLAVAGALDIERGADGDTRYHVRGADVDVKGVDLVRWGAWIERFGATAETATALPPVRAAATTASPLLAALGRHGGLLDLTGRVEGTWPHQVDVQLTSTASALHARIDDDVSIDDGTAQLRLSASVIGVAERILFDLFVGAGAHVKQQDYQSRERGTISARGRYERAGDEFGLLRLDQFDLHAVEIGRMSGSGSIAQLEVADTPTLDLDLRLREFQVTRILELAGGTLLPQGVEVDADSIDLDVELRGDVDGPAADARLTKPVTVRFGEQDRSVTASVEGNVTGWVIDRARRETAFETARLRFDRVDPDALATLLSARTQDRGPVLSASGGVLNMSLEVRNFSQQGGVTTADAELDATLTAEAVAISALDFEAEPVDATAHVSAELRPDQPLRFRLGGALEVGDFLAGSAGATLSGQKSHAHVTGTIDWTNGGQNIALATDTLRFTTPLTGVTTGTVQLERRSEAPQWNVDLSLSARRADAARAFDAFALEALRASYDWAEDSSARGTLGVDLQVNGLSDKLAVSGRWLIENGTLELGSTIVSGLSLDLPFANRTHDEDRSVPLKRGRLGFSSIASPLITVGATQTDLRFRRGTYGLTDPLRVPLLGGELFLGALTYSRTPGRDPTWRASGEARDFDLAAVMQALGLPPAPGRIGARFHPVWIRGTRMEWNGEINIDAFGGSISFADLQAEDLLQPYFSLALERGTIASIRLDEMGRTFDFGLISGVLDGSLEHLEFVGGELSRFDLEVGSVKTRGVKQFVDRRAIESIRRVLEGPLGAIEETFFSRFGYHRFGFQASLDRNVFRLRGEQHTDGREYIMRGRWYQFPRIDIINANPGRDYDWERILHNLRSISASNEVNEHDDETSQD